MSIDTNKAEVSRLNVYNALVTDRPDVWGPIETICILKLDYIGDLVIALPALAALRTHFPSASLEIVCGSWNRDVAQASGLFAKIHVVDDFKDHTRKADKAATARLPAEVTDKTYDLAIDLRVQEETRDILARIDARIHAGIGQAVPSHARSIVLPRQWTADAGMRAEACQYLPVRPTNLWQAGRFLPQERVVRCVDYDRHKSLIMFGPLSLSAGRYRAVFACDFVPRRITWRPVVMLSVFAVEHVIAERCIVLGREYPQIAVDFSVSEDSPPVDFRLRVRKGRFERMDFGGMLLVRLPEQMSNAVGSAEAVAPMRSRSHLHMAEQLLLLVQLVAARLGRASIPRLAPTPAATPDRATIAVAPFSNSAIRDWPAAHYRDLLVELSRHYDHELELIGNADQSARLADMQGTLTASGIARVSVRAGLPMAEVIATLSRSALVICNNSGIAHLAGALGRPVVAMYSASHEVDEWGAVGPNVWIIQAEIACQGCGLDLGRHCHNEHRCMRDLRPSAVAELILGKVVWAGRKFAPQRV